MATEKQIRANRLNAQRSPGPRTIDGKARSSRNALAHGLTANCVLIPGQCREDYERLRYDIWQEYDPQTPTEEELTERLVSLLWRLRRVPAFESALMLWTTRFTACVFDDNILPIDDLIGAPHALSEPNDTADEEELGRHESFVLGRTLDQMIKKGDIFSKISTYEAGLVRKSDRTLDRLNDLIDRRKAIQQRIAAEDAEVVNAAQP
jgi:hypothetical protein